MTTITQLSTVTASSSKPPMSSSHQLPQTVATLEESTTLPKPSSNRRDLVIGVGVSLSFTVAALSVLGILLLRQRRRKRHARKTMSDYAKSWLRNSNGIKKAQLIHGIPRELSATAIGPNELHCQHIIEAGTGHRVAVIFPVDGNNPCS